MASRTCQRIRKTIISVDRIIRRKAADQPHKNAAAIARELRSKNIAEISRWTFSRRLHAVDFLEIVRIYYKCI